MKLREICRILGLFIIFFSWLLLLPACIAFIYRDGAGIAFIKGFFYVLLIGLVIWYANRGKGGELKSREGFLIAVLFWVILGSMSAIPFIVDDHVNLSITDAFFESFSSLTTTGATIITNLDTLPKAFLFYRHLLQWLGGIGIIVLAVAVLPILGIGGMQIYRAGLPGPERNDKIRPRIAQTAKTLWLIYLSLTTACATALWGAGMDLFDAVCHAFSVLSL